MKRIFSFFKRFREMETKVKELEDRVRHLDDDIDKAWGSMVFWKRKALKAKEERNEVI